MLIGAVESMRSAFGARLLAAYALGSLAHGGFSAAVSDIDLGVVVSDPIHPEDADSIKRAADAESLRVGGFAISPLCDRLSVFWATPSALAEGTGAGRFPPHDRLDLIEYGRLLAGTDIRARVARPSPDELLVSGAEFSLELLAGPLVKQIASASAEREVRDVTKLVLFPVRLMFTASTARVGVNDDAVEWYLAVERAPSTALVAAALRWRSAGRFDRDAEGGLLREQIVPLYRYFVESYLVGLRALEPERPDLVRAFERWRASFQQ